MATECTLHVKIHYTLSQWDKSGRSVTSSSVSDRSVGDGEFTQVVADHLGLDFDGVENLTVVNTNDGTDHFWDNNHVSQVGLDNGRLLIRLGSQLGGSQFVDQTHRLGSQSSGESSSDSGTTQLGEFFGWHFQQVLEVDTSEGEGLEHSFSLSWGLVQVQHYATHTSVCHKDTY